MTFTITVEQDVEIPDDELLSLADAVRSKWQNLSADDPVAAEDLLIQAEIRGLIQLPYNWRGPDEAYSNADLTPRPPKKARRKRK